MYPNACNAGGRFFAPKYQANASWAIIEGKLHVDWAKYGKYQLAITNESPPAFEVCAVTHKHACSRQQYRTHISCTTYRTHVYIIDVCTHCIHDIFLCASLLAFMNSGQA